MIYNCDRDDISVRTEGRLKGREEEYLRCLGKHIFNEEEYFSFKKKFNLDSLRKVLEISHDFATTPGIEEVIITELQFLCAGETEIRKSSNLIHRLITKNKSFSKFKSEDKSFSENITQGSFNISFDDHDQNRTLSLVSNSNKAIFGRDDDGSYVEDWIHDQGFTTSHPLSKDS